MDPDAFRPISKGCLGGAVQLSLLAVSPMTLAGMPARAQVTKGEAHSLSSGFLPIDGGNVTVDQARLQLPAAQSEEVLHDSLVAVDDHFASADGRQSCLEMLIGSSCGGESGLPCVSLRGASALQIADTLIGAGITFTGPLLEVPGSEDCVGWRPDIGGTRQGALCLLEILPANFRLQDPSQGINCSTDGFPYNIFTTEEPDLPPPIAPGDDHGDSPETATPIGLGTRFMVELDAAADIDFSN